MIHCYSACGRTQRIPKTLPKIQIFHPHGSTLGGGNSKIWLIFTRIPGVSWSNLTVRIFFKGVGEKPPASLSLSFRGWEFQEFSSAFPTQDASDHQDYYIFSRDSFDFTFSSFGP